MDVFAVGIGVPASPARPAAITPRTTSSARDAGNHDPLAAPHGWTRGCRHPLLWLVGGGKSWIEPDAIAHSLCHKEVWRESGCITMGLPEAELEIRSIIGLQRTAAEN